MPKAVTKIRVMRHSLTADGDSCLAFANDEEYSTIQDAVRDCREKYQEGTYSFVRIVKDVSIRKEERVVVDIS